MGAAGLAGEVAVHCAGDDAGVGNLRAMEADEVLAVQREQHAVFGSGVAKDFLLGPCLSGAAGFEDDSDVAAETAEFLDDGERKILVGVEPEHASSVRLVFGNGAFNFLAMAVMVGPSVGEILGVQRGVRAKDVRFSKAALAGADKCPDRDARAADAGFAAADGGIAIHAGKALSEIACDDLQERGLFTGRHSRQESFGIGEQWHGKTLCQRTRAVHRTGWTERGV